LGTKAFSQVTRYALIAPITRTVRNWPFEVLIVAGLQVAGAVLTDQVRSVDFEARHAKFLGQAPLDLVNEVLGRIASIMEE
jgi:mRNA interferase MazF